MNDRETVPYKIRIQRPVEIYVPGDVLTYRSPDMYAFVGAVFGISLQRAKTALNNNDAVPVNDQVVNRFV